MYAYRLVDADRVAAKAAGCLLARSGKSPDQIGKAPPLVFCVNGLQEEAI
jgi:hypothetical protein